MSVIRSARVRISRSISTADARAIVTGCSASASLTVVPVWLAASRCRSRHAFSAVWSGLVQ